MGAGRNTKEESIDYSAGIMLVKKTGDFVNEGDVIAYLYTSDLDRIVNAEIKFLSSTTISENKPEERPLVFEKVE